jgi:hypothetical protein
MVNIFKTRVRLKYTALLFSTLVVSMLYSVQSYAIQPRIIGGADQVKPAWLVAIINTDVNSPTPNNEHCAGELVNTNWILTAAHCVDGINENVNDLRVVTGTANLTDGTGVENRIVQTVRHPTDDIALIRIAAQTGPFVPLPTHALNENLDNFPKLAGGTTVRAMGWGASGTATPEPYPGVLQGKNLTIETDENCGEAPTDMELCARNDNGGVYFADSGGPLLLNGVLYGVVNRGVGDNIDEEAIFARIPRYIDWISNQVCAATPLNTPTLSVSISGNNATINRTNSTDNVDHILYYVPVLNWTNSEILDANVGTTNPLVYSLNSGFDYYVAMKDVDGPCVSNLSNLIRVTVP